MRSAVDSDAVDSLGRPVSVLILVDMSLFFWIHRYGDMRSDFGVLISHRFVRTLKMLVY
jgi:hypothetical protein